MNGRTWGDTGRVISTWASATQPKSSLGSVWELSFNQNFSDWFHLFYGNSTVSRGMFTLLKISLAVCVYE